MKKVVVTQLAFYNRSRVRPGAVLEVPDDLRGSWFAPINSAAAKAATAPKPVEDTPHTLSEMANARPVRAVPPPVSRPRAEP